jgi:hypothetical protein
MSRADETRRARCSPSHQAGQPFYLTGDGRLGSFAMISQKGEFALGMPSTDVENVKSLARFDHFAGFENEVGMIRSIAHYFNDFGIREGAAGLEYTSLTQSM